MSLDLYDLHSKYYYCVNNGDHKDQGTINVKAEPISKLVLSSVMFALNSKNVQELLIEKIQSEQAEDGQIDQHKRQGKTRRVNTLMKKFEDGNISASEFQTKLKKVEEDTEAMTKTKPSRKDKVEMFNQDATLRRIIVNKMIDRVEVINKNSDKYLTGIYLHNSENNLIKAKIKID